jgi:hypothetical protein
VADAGQMGAEHIDRCRLADAGRAGNADADRVAGCGQEVLDQPGGLAAMIAAPALNERNRACQHGAVAGVNAADKAGDVRGEGGRLGA